MPSEYIRLGVHLLLEAGSRINISNEGSDMQAYEKQHVTKRDVRRRTGTATDPEFDITMCSFIHHTARPYCSNGIPVLSSSEPIFNSSRRISAADSRSWFYRAQWPSHRIQRALYFNCEATTHSVEESRTESYFSLGVGIYAT